MKPIIRVLLTVAILLGSASASASDHCEDTSHPRYDQSECEGTSSGDYRKGLEAYHKKDYATALREWKPLTEQGDPYAQQKVGGMYERGEGVPQDYETALKWFRLAAQQEGTFQEEEAQMRVEALEEKIAEQKKSSPTVSAQKSPTPSSGNYQKGRDAFKRKDYATALREWKPLAEQGGADAQYNLGLVYTVTQDYKTAVKWYRLAAEQGHAHAQYNLGVLYQKGQGVPKDIKVAAKWWKHAAKQGFVAAQSNMGIMYANGQGVIKDPVSAYMWSQIAASKGDKNGTILRDWLDKRMSPSQIEKSKRLARNFAREKEKIEREKREAERIEKIERYRLAANQGSADAQFELGEMYNYGKGVEVNREIALKWYRLASAQGHAEARLRYEAGEKFAREVTRPKRAREKREKVERIAREKEKIAREKREKAERIAREKREKAERIAREKREKSEQIAKYKEKILLLSEEWGGDLKNLKYHYLNIWRLNEADYATALKGLTPLAEKGNSDAQYILGKMRTGAPLWKKDKESNNRTECEFFEVGIKWLTLAAKGGHSQATVDLVFLYDRGVFGYPDCNIKNKGTSNKWDTIFKKLVNKKNIEADKIWNRYNSREKTLSEEVLNYSTMNKRSGIGLSENWLTNEKKNYYWVSERKNQCIVKSNYPYTNESGGNSFPKTINIKKLNRTAFRIGREFSNDKWKWIFSEGSTVILSVNDKGQDMATLQKAWRLLFRKCPGKKSRF